MPLWNFESAHYCEKMKCNSITIPCQSSIKFVISLDFITKLKVNNMLLKTTYNKKANDKEIDKC